MSQSNVFDHLPKEIVVEILHRLPVKSLVRFTSVCKAWNSLITDQTFISDHLNHTTIQASNGNGSLFFQFCVKHDRGQDHFHKEDFYSLYSDNQQADHFSVERFPLSHLFRRDRYTLFAGTCNGLVCSADYSPLDSAAILIWNPLLRKHAVLPKPIMTCKKRNRQHYPKYDLCYGFGFDSRNNDYKVVRLMNLHSEQDTTHVEVYSLVSRSWRSITVRVPQFHLSDHEWLPPVFVNGAVHWVVSRRKCDGSIHRFILSFDVIEETFGELTLLQQLSFSIQLNLLVVEGGHSLAVVNNYKVNKYQRHFDIWVMKEYGITESWAKVFSCTNAKRDGGLYAILALTSSGKVVMSLTDGDIVLANTVKGSLEPVGHQSFSNEAYAGSYIESLFFISKEPDVLSF